MIREPHKHLFYELKGLKPPTVFVDNNYGFTVYLPITGGYKNTSLRYSSIKEVGGLNVYCSSESIGVCIFKNDTMFSCIDMSMDDFFEADISPSASVSVLYATRVSSTHAIISACVNVNPSVDDLLFASKVFVLDGARLNVSTILMPPKATILERDNYGKLYEEDGSYTGEKIDDKFLTYEGYNDSTGFGSVGVELVEFPNGIDDAMKKLTDLTIRDIISVSPELSDLRVNDAYSVKSMMMDDKMYFIGLTAEKVYTVYGEPGAYEYEEWLFDTQLQQDKFDNVLSQPIEIIPVYKKGAMSEYNLIYVPMGLVVEHNKFKFITFTRPEKNDQGESILAEYLITTKKEADGKVVLSPKLNQEGKIVSTSSVKTEVDADSSRYTLGLTLKSINPSSYMETTMGGRNFGTVHSLYPVGSIPGQGEAVETVKSMCDMIPYK